MADYRRIGSEKGYTLYWRADRNEAVVVRGSGAPEREGQEIGDARSPDEALRIFERWISRR